VVKEVEPMTEDNIMDKMIKNIDSTIEKNIEMLDATLDIAKASGDAEHIESYASIVKANNEMVKLAISIKMDREKLKQQKELKILEIESKEKIAAGKSSSKKDGAIMQQNNFLFSGPREAIFDLLGNKPEDREKALLKLQEMNPPIDV
jgi:predicted RND superfamily exporter protein